MFSLSNSAVKYFAKSSVCFFLASLQAVRAKDTFRKFVDSVLQKSAKIRTLISDLIKNYPEDDTAQKHPICI